jgi:hypothetical protein
MMARSLRRLIVSVILFGTLSAIGAESPFEIAISADQDTVKSGNSLVITITVTNTSDHDITLDDTSPHCDYAVSVWDSSGKAAQETPMGRTMKIKNICATFSLRHTRPTLKPITAPSNDSGLAADVSHLVITDLYDITRRAGQYTIQVERKLPEQLGSGIVRSNTITVTVTE